MVNDRTDVLARGSRVQTGETTAVWLMIPAAAVDQSIAGLVASLESGDILIDGGNSYYVDDIRRAKEPRRAALGERAIDTRSDSHWHGNRGGATDTASGWPSPFRRAERTPFFRRTLP
jgi:6-phosphogluconate dehydrogenase (decarboxylating)